MERVTFRHHAAKRGVGKAIISLRHLHSSPFTCHPIQSARTAGWHCIHEWPQNIINWITWGSICHCVCQIARARGRIIPFRLALCARVFVWLSECWHRLSCFCLVNSSFYKYESSARREIKLWVCVCDMMLLTKKNSAAHGHFCFLYTVIPMRTSKRDAVCEYHLSGCAQRR
jgi:hypothetical protein